MPKRKKSSGRRTRWINLSRAREAHRLSRLGRTYDPERLYRKLRGRKKRFQTNPKFRIARPRNGTFRIKLPEKLNFQTAEDVQQVFMLVEHLREVALRGGYRRIVLEQDDVVELAPEVAIILLAELQRCAAYCIGRTAIGGTYPRDSRVAELLTNLGFYDAIGVPAPALPQSYDRRVFIKVESGHQTNSETIDVLLGQFEQLIHLPIADKRNLHVAILECMDNVREHAYIVSSDTPHLYREWWLVGFVDTTTKTASFIFYDQGLGIVRTVREHAKKRFARRLPLWTDARWIGRVVTKKYSRHDSKRRGHGLPKLQQFIKDAELDGSMRVLANRGEYIQISGKPSETRIHKVSAPGTMISWSLSLPPDIQLSLDL